MQRKESESRLAKMMHHYNAWLHKWPDVMVCRNCHYKIYESFRHVDYLAIVGNHPINIEAKEGKDGFPWANEEIGIRPIQRQIMDDWEKWGVESWLFILLGNGSLPMGKAAYLVDWGSWKILEEEMRLEGIGTLPWKSNQRKISSRFNAQRVLDNYTLGYGREQPGDKIGFFVPRLHPFGIRYPELFFLSPMSYWTIKSKESTDGFTGDTTEADDPA